MKNSPLRTVKRQNADQIHYLTTRREKQHENSSQHNNTRTAQQSITTTTFHRIIQRRSRLGPHTDIQQRLIACYSQY